MTMTIIRKTLFGAAFAALAMAATAADATVYIGADSVGTTSITLSVTTDGTLGTLAAANITGWTITFADPNPLNNIVLTPMNSAVFMVGDAVSATASSLTFDFDSGGVFGRDAIAFNEDPGVPGFEHYYCLDTNFACTGPDRRAFRNAAVVRDQRAHSAFNHEARSGIGVIGTATGVTGAVPEPASWAMMLTGFGLLGAVARRRPARSGYANVIS
jgi:PEP-CTERM motif